jgi:methyl-accepting chemotaxis protein
MSWGDFSMIRIPRMRMRLPRVPLPAVLTSVRGRISFLTAAPLTALVIVAGTYWYGQQQVNHAVQVSGEYSDVATQVERFRGRLAAMGTAVADFRLAPSDRAMRSFKQAEHEAGEALKAIRDRMTDENFLSTVDILDQGLASTREAFDRITKAQDVLGIGRKDGVDGKLLAVGDALDVSLDNDLGPIADEAYPILNAFQRVRRDEKTYMISGSDKVAEDFDKTIAGIEKSVASSILDEPAKAKIKASLDGYSKLFDQWRSAKKEQTTASQVMGDSLDSVEMNTGSLLGLARSGKENSLRAQVEANHRTNMIALGIIVAAMLLCGTLGFFIGRSVSRPIGELTTAMRRLAEGDTSIVVHGADRRGELADMARAVLVFRDNAVEREQLAEEQARSATDREKRARAVEELVRGFEERADAAIASVRSAAGQLESTSTNLVAASTQVLSEAKGAAAAATSASTNVTAAAGGTEELTVSIQEIDRQANRSTEVSQRAVSEATRTSETMTSLAAAATRIGEVVNLIQAIAAQTNLLALNATIEAARAGEAGKGFAVVAQEVKSLASQTANATEEIARQIGAIQEASGDAAVAMDRVNSIIGEMSQIATAVAGAVEEQSAAVRSIASSVAQASSEAQAGASAMEVVGGAADSARSVADDVAALAGGLSQEAQSLETAVRSFLEGVQAA